ncbi:hypothetical protein PsorP6_006800 [Peronosclerospora sorghi]|uniref:Uncharacterized protein n=1 Tax=Peronosclerospora sorghi TaxID=230839 RepID=A0ACC0W3K8_9STRA|nr:hypothetical protein PsorP6_006800 [Peronosclerospora sorghi]
MLVVVAIDSKAQRWHHSVMNTLTLLGEEKSLEPVTQGVQASSTQSCPPSAPTETSSTRRGETATDAIEGEELWFVDRCGTSVRSLYCLGLIDSINRKFGPRRVCSLAEAELDKQEPFARALRDLALAEIPDTLNT